MGAISPRLPPTVITLTTDFGWTELPSAMKGVIRHIAPPGTEVVDINHGVPPQDIIQGAYAMLTVCPIYFQDVPPGDPFFVYVRCLACRALLNGYPCGGPFEPCVPPANQPYFRPGNNATRGQICKIVYQAISTP